MLSMRLSAILLACLWLVACQKTITADLIAQGPIVGAVTSDSVTIWVRTKDAGQVSVTYGNPSQTVTSATDATSDFTTKLKIAALAPAQTYSYQLSVNGTPQLNGNFTTFPIVGDSKPFRFALLTDFRTVSTINQPVDTFKSAAHDNPAFVIIGGDFDHRNPVTIQDKRQMFLDLYTPAMGMQDFVNLILTKYTVAHFWDDHDYGLNNGDKTYPNKKISLSILDQYFPLYPIGPNGDWQQFTYGDADFFLLDSRSQRDETKEPDSPDKSMLDGDNLGDAGQKTWLFNGLKNSQATWKFILTPVIFNPTTKAWDSWGAYQTERQEILDFVRLNRIANVIFLAGDIHMGAIDDGKNSGLPEMVAPSVNDGFDTRCATIPTGDLGKWSVGIYGDAGSISCNGYSLIDVSPDNVNLIVKDSQGGIRVQYTVKKKD